MTPNGVIWGGAVDGSNQVGAMVTWKAITACPAGWAAAGTAAARASAAAISGRTSGRRRVDPVVRGMAALRARASYHPDRGYRGLRSAASPHATERACARTR